MASRSILAAMGSRPRSLLAALVGPTFGRVGPFEEPGGRAPGTRYRRREQTACRLPQRQTSRLIDTFADSSERPVTKRRRDSGKNYPVKRREKASKKREERSDL